MSDKLVEIEESVLSKDPTSVYRTAHAIKSMSANIGAEQVRIISASIEKQGRENNLAEVGEAIALLAAAYHEFVGEFEAEISI